MNKILIAIVILTAIVAQAENTEFVTAIGCEANDGTSVSIQRRVVDIYTSAARIEERIRVGNSIALVQERTITNNNTYTYVVDGIALAVTLDWNSLTVTSSTGDYFVSGTGVLNVRGQAQRSLTCELYDSM